MQTFKSRPSWCNFSFAGRRKIDFFTIKDGRATVFQRNSRSRSSEVLPTIFSVLVLTDFNGILLANFSHFWRIKHGENFTESKIQVEIMQFYSSTRVSCGIKRDKGANMTSASRTHRKIPSNLIVFLFFSSVPAKFFSSRFSGQSIHFSGHFQSALTIDSTHLSSDLVTALAGLNMNDFTHSDLSVVCEKYKTLYKSALKRL